MPSLQLKTTWSIFSFLMLAAGAVMIAFSVIWRAPDPLRNFVISEMDLDAALILGIMFSITWVISIGGFIQQNHVVMGLIITNWALILDAAATIVVGCIVWFYTLTPTKNYLEQWQTADTQTIQMIQDSLSCCGYRNGTEFGVPTGFCATNINTAPGCYPKIFSYADQTLNNVFTTIFGFMGVVIGFFLATVCVVNKRRERERFRKIDAKRGGRGFV
ncbi:phospholipid scramblase 1 [Tulasnella sp. 419]|nr:phospholipid scramblase 1 [Tulasnella sp. 418]KAG8954564.1 phospholipid scramblase 1 [Tulasnella sp. 419]